MGHDEEVLKQVPRLSCGPSSALRNFKWMKAVEEVFVNTQLHVKSMLYYGGLCLLLHNCIDLSAICYRQNDVDIYVPIT